MSSLGCASNLPKEEDEIFDNLCDPCNYEGSKEEGVKYCFDCEEWLCFKCTDSHKKFKVSRNHMILYVAQVARQTVGIKTSCVVLCENCQNVEVTDFCEQHNAVICQACRSVRHRNCNPKSIIEKGRSYDGRKLDLVAKSVKEAEDKVDNFHQERKADLHSLLLLKDICSDKIKSSREEVLKCLNKLEQTAMKELNDFVSDERQKLESHILASSSTKQMLEADSELIKDAMKTSITGEMFAVDVKITNRLKEYEQVLQDLYQEATTPFITFIPNKKLIKMLDQLDKLGNLIMDHKPIYKQKHRLFNDIRVQSLSQTNIKLPGDKDTSGITGCDVLPNGQILLCDCGNDNLKLLHSSFTVKEVLELQAELWDVSVINNSSAIITLPYLKQLKYLQLEPSLKSERIIQLDKMCWGIAVADEDIYVTLHNRPGQGEIRILDMKGSLKRRIGVVAIGTFMFESPYYLTQSATTGKIYVSDQGTATVTCLMPDGSSVYQYKDKELKRPNGVCVDNEENVIVCDGGSNNVHIITDSGKKHGCLLTLRDGIKLPLAVAYTKDTLIVGCDDRNSLSVYKMTC